MGLTSDSNWGARNTFFLVTLYNFQKSGTAIALPAPPSPRSLFRWLVVSNKKTDILVCYFANGKIQIVTRRFRTWQHRQILAFSFSLVTLKFSVHNFFVRIFDAEFPYRRSYLEPLCLPAKMAAETVTRSISSLTKS